MFYGTEGSSQVGFLDTRPRMIWGKSDTEVISLEVCSESAV